MKPLDLSHFKIFKNVPTSILDNLSKKLKIRSYPKKSTILKKGESDKQLLFLLNGQAEIFDFDSDGSDVWVATLYPGDHFGEIALILDEPRSADVIASSPSTVAFLSKDEAINLLTNNPIVAHNMIRYLAKKIKQQNQHIYMLNLPCAADRIKALLLMKAKKYAHNMFVIENLPSQGQIAKMANTSRETVSRTLSHLSKDNIIEKDYKRLIIRKPEALMTKK